MIGTNKKDALDTVTSMFEDLEAGRDSRARAERAQSIAELLDERGGDHVTYMGWQAIDRAEQAAGEPHGRPRVKFCRVARDGRGARATAVAELMADLAELKAMIEAALPGAEVEVIDEGGGDHLRAVVTAPQFEGLSRIDQHRLVRAAVKPRFDDGSIHALSIQTIAPRAGPALSERDRTPARPGIEQFNRTGERPDRAVRAGRSSCTRRRRSSTRAGVFHGPGAPQASLDELGESFERHDASSRSGSSKRPAARSSSSIRRRGPSAARSASWSSTTHIAVRSCTWSRRRRRRSPARDLRVSPSLTPSTADRAVASRTLRYPEPMAADPALKQQVEQAIADNPVLLFMKGTPEAPRCGFSMRVVGVLEQLGVDYGAIDVLPALQPLREVTTELSDWQTFPQLYVNGELVGGCDIVEEMLDVGRARPSCSASSSPRSMTAPEPERILPGGSQTSPPMQLG